MLDFLLRPIRRRFGADRRYYAMIDDMFGFIPNNIELYKLALIHKSASVMLPDGRAVNNERLEYLGDAVIETVTSDYLFIEFPDRDEGFLTQLRSKIVSRQSLNALAETLGLDRHLTLNHAPGNGITQKHIYGDAFEAMMGAIYLDQGYNFVNRLLINRIFFRHLDLGQLTAEETDFKSRLIEWCQKNRYHFSFRTTHDRNGRADHPVFYTTIVINGMEVGHGAGESKKEAEQHAAFSVAHFMSDEQCASMLDRFDRLVRKGERPARTANAAGAERAGDTADSLRPANAAGRDRPINAAEADRAANAKEVNPLATAAGRDRAVTAAGSDRIGDAGASAAGAGSIPGAGSISEAAMGAASGTASVSKTDPVSGAPEVPSAASAASETISGSEAPGTASETSGTDSTPPPALAPAPTLTPSAAAAASADRPAPQRMAQ